VAFTTGQASGYSHLLELLNRFITGNPHETGRVEAQGTATVLGNGVLSNFLVDPAAATQTWTIACVTAGTAGTFSVVGSTHGTAATAVVGTAYTLASEISFQLLTGTTAFAAGNVFTVTVGAGIGGADQWVIDRYTASNQMIMHGPGAGTDTIYVGVSLTSNTAGDYYNWKLQGFTGFNSALLFESQPGALAETLSPVHLPLWNGEMTYWFMVTGRRIIVVAKVSTVYEMCYLGFIDQFASPNQYPYPLFIGGALAWGSTNTPAVTSANWRWSYTGNEHRHFWEPIYVASNFPNPATGRGQARLRTLGGTWRDFWCGDGGDYDVTKISSGTTFRDAASIDAWTAGFVTETPNGSVWPGCCKIDAMEACVDGSYLLIPNVLLLGVSSGDAPDIAGELNGLARVTGGLAAEDVITFAGDNWLVIPNVFRSNRQDYCAVRLA
jgi:hypothetical protein